ncbi:MULTISPECIES: DNA translocase FtsK [unclassified Vibrio]|uniref:DNA translocase FtsK n=2 Tax=Vibrio TaxID=662 RepID=UPI000B8E4985|nr:MULTISPECIES: DNA translocase FtsK [unclassified Vibrio]OXX25937.1 cell division protein FtsK [Vibrio sp. V05_P4A8T149]OXX28640.1 cell division protein FtsK [Vibrio sp. V06_P1A73T115]OXX32029.1 cell division protein FtsK [Vibrio sp. V04_P4A5T148]OXX32324.1 cell division protein FtsK [Vibrio sp. V14_P6S14T42]OXX57740.1 cell division protein FtsK [Vibrio sp. V18_P1S4T112]
MFKENQNKVETIIKTSEEPQSSRLNGSQRLKECGLIVAVLASVLLSIALLTFSPADPSWSQTAWGGDIENAGGIIGAWIADTLFFIFGSLAYPIPLMITVLAWVFLRKREENEPLDFVLWGTRLLGLTILILTSCGLADINFDDIWYFSSGGVIGDVLTSLALPTLNLLGSTLVLLFLWGAGFTLLTGISWLSIVEWLGTMSISLGVALINRLRGEKDEDIAPVLSQMELSPLESSSADLAVVESSSPNEEYVKSALDAFGAEQYTTAVEVEEELEQTHSPRRFNIHMPAAKTQANTSPEFSDTHSDEAPFDRSKQLSATIEELESVALEEDDLALSSADWVDERANEHNEHQALASADLDASQEAQQYAWAEDEEVSDPSLTMTEVDLEVSRVEPVISNLDVLDEDESDQALAADLDVMSEDDEPPLGQQDSDVTAFQNMVSSAQANMAAKQNPFLMQKETNLPKPTEPLPTLELLYHPEKREHFIDRDALEEVARLVESKLADYKIQAQVVDIFPGPVITRFELDLAPGVKVSRISSLSMDLARSLSAMAVRVVEVIPGKPYVGLELPNMSRQTVYLSDVIKSRQFQEAKSPTTIVLGQDIAGEALVADLAKMPHVLVAGTTGSGKSVGVNVMILSMLYKASPEDVRFIMIDPKMLELSIYEGIPHLLAEVVTDMKDASNALRWCVGEMERRYKLMSVLGVRNIKGFNDKLKMAAAAGHPIHDPLWREGDSMESEPPLLEKLPYIVVVVDEFADLMMVVGKKVEELIARLAQKARAAGIHLILATQRPSVDVITGLIKANIPTRVAFTVSTKTDSRTILDQSGAESLLGMGDMLYLPPGSSHTIRVHGAFASDEDVHAVVNNWKARGKPNYIEEITYGDQGPEALLPGEKMESDEEVDPLFDQVVEHVVETRRGSVSGVQRRFKIGYNRAARIVEQLEAQGIVSAPGHNGNREVLSPAPPRD